MDWGILGHEWAVELLHGHLAGGQARHAYLFTGPAGVGRRTLALRLAQALNCANPPAPGVPCGACRVCRQIEKMQHPDLSVVQAEEAGGTLKVEQVRELQRRLALAPYEARYRVALLLRFEEAHPSAANALLKTLEEPPPAVVLLLTAESPERLLPTIVSRCEVLRLRPLPLETVEAGLRQRWDLEAGQARLLAHLSGGRPGAAVGLLRSPAQLEQRGAWLDDLIRLLGANRAARFAYAEGLAREKAPARQALQTWLSLWRDALICASRAGVSLANPDREAQARHLAERAGPDAARQAVAALSRSLELLETNANLRLLLEVLLLDLPLVRLPGPAGE
jgi:DNA polymerase-3 subunit delta'